MKRFLFYLIISLGFSLFFNSSTEAARCLNKNFKESVRITSTQKCPNNYYELDVNTADQITRERNKLNKKLLIELR